MACDARFVEAVPVTCVTFHIILIPWGVFIVKNIILIMTQWQHDKLMKIKLLVTYLL